MKEQGVRGKFKALYMRTERELPPSAQGNCGNIRYGDLEGFHFIGPSLEMPLNHVSGGDI